MVRVSTLKNRIHTNLESNLRRVYPILKGPKSWGNLRQKRDEFHDPKGRFPLVNEPLIEAIPQYEIGKNTEPANLSKSASTDLNKERLERLSEYLGIAGDDWPLYPHQKEALEGYLDGKDVVIATGTGSGKTESFLFPMFSHLDSEAIRCSEDEEESQRALKAVILYPMNALVADQMKRIRKYLGNPEIAAKFMNNGYGRFPQFGMYTGRTDYHGWYKISQNNNKSKTQRRMGDLISNYKDLQERKDAWTSLQNLGKVPAIGGKVELDSDGYLKYDQLSTKAKREAWDSIDPKTGKKLNKSALKKKYVLEPKEQTFDRFNNQDLNPNPASASVPGGHVKWMGDKLDRELVVRHQMHQGGLRQHLDENNFNGEYTNEILNQTGIPDVLVTNYSMLEYMLMRPLEHVFWHNTGEWLRNCERKEDPLLRRKLLLVVDEAHLYQGAMGTEFSLLLNRILSVLGDDIQRDQIQFIITSASLGEREENKVKYAKDLLSLNENRAENLVIPKSKIISIDGDDKQRFFTKKELKYFVEAWEEIDKGTPRQEAELALLNSLFGTKANDNFEHFESQGFTKQSAYESTCYELIHKEWCAVRLMRLLLQPNELSKLDKDLITEYYNKDELLRNELDKPLDRIPRRFSLIQEFMFEEESDASAKATEVLLDLIASARLHENKNGKISPKKPLLPVRAHLFVRGNTVNRICCKCGTIYENGELTCAIEKCQARTYTLYFDRNCGGVYLQLWLEGDVNNFRFTWQKGRPYPNPRDFGNAKRTHQARELQFSGRQPSDRLLGALARVLDDDDDSVTHWLDPYSGFLSLIKKQDMIPIRMSRFRDGLFNFNSPSDNPWNARTWEAKNGFVEPRECFYCQGNYERNSRTSQFSDTETRGDEYFCGIITEAISIQDSDSTSKTPHKGKKMLVFSDGRQRAARLSAKLSNSIAVDEGRALFTYLHRRPWFKKLNRDRRNLDRIYPYMCLLSGSFGLNYLSDNVNNPEKTRMLVHTSSLASWILWNIHCDRKEFSDLKSELLDDMDTDEIESKEMLAQIKSAFKSAIYSNSPKEEDDDATKAEKEANKKTLEDYKSKNIDPSDIDGFDAYSDFKKKKEIKKLISTYDRQRLRKLSNSRQLCLCLGTRTLFLEDTKYGHIEISKIITRSIILDMEENKLDPNILDEYIESWLNDILSNDVEGSNDRVPSQFGSLIIKWIVDKNFGLQELGLGTFKLIIEEEDASKLSPTNLSLMENMIPELLRSYEPISGERIGNNAIVTSSEGRIISKNSKGAFTKDSHWNAFDYSTPRSHTIGNKSELSGLIVEWIEDTFNNLDSEIEKILESSYEKYFKIFESNPLLRDQMPWSLKAEKVIFEPWEGNTREGFQSCDNCHLPKYNTGLLCLNCGSTGHRDLSDLECEDYFLERLEHWRNRVIQLEKSDYSSDNASALQIFRAEEHTAQIGQKLDNDLLFSGTELHELMFQDIPLKGRGLGMDTKIEQPPIDILSCTTTMEVGIDIGNLTAVALRTVPPHSANYQQRVGRAGRGKSEVSLALTWVDNSAYAQAHFTVPERLVKHPEEAPNLYLDNQKIKQRHFNAVCFQRYFKRKKYHIDTLTFEDMNPEMGQSNLLESLGTSDGFFSCTNPSYSSKSMVDWLGKISPEVKEKIMQSTKTSAAEYDAWKKQLTEWLNKETKNFKEAV